MPTKPPPHYEHLERRPGSWYRQLFIKGTRIRAEVIYGMTVDGAPPHMTPEEVAEDMSLPIDAVRDAIRYCEAYPEEIEADHAREEALMEATGMNDPNYNGSPRRITPEERNRIFHS